MTAFAAKGLIPGRARYPRAKRFSHPPTPPRQQQSAEHQIQVWKNVRNETERKRCLGMDRLVRRAAGQVVSGENILTSRCLFPPQKRLFSQWSAPSRLYLLACVKSMHTNNNTEKKTHE